MTLKRDCSNKFADSVPSTVPQNLALHQRFCLPEAALLLARVRFEHYNQNTPHLHPHPGSYRCMSQRKKETCSANITHVLKRYCFNKFSDSVASTVPQNIALQQRFLRFVASLRLSHVLFQHCNHNSPHPHLGSYRCMIQRTKEACNAKIYSIWQLKSSSDQCFNFATS